MDSPHSGSSVLDLDHYYHCRFAPRAHPKTEEVQANVRTYYFENLFKDSVAHREKYLSQDLGDFCYFELAGARDEQLQIAHLYIQYFFYWDDYLEKLDEKTEKLALDQALGILSGTKDPDPNDQMQLILKDLVLALTSYGEEGDRLRAEKVLATTRDYLICVCQTKERKESLANIDTYKKYRVMDGAIWPVLTVTWWSYGIKLPMSVLEGADIERLGFVTGLQAVLVNDLYSYRVEVLRAHQNNLDSQNDSDYPYTAISALMDEKGVDAQTAMDLIKVMIYELEEEFVNKSNELRARFQGGELEMFDKLLEGYRDVMSGNWIWSTFCGRYNLLPDPRK